MLTEDHAICKDSNENKVYWMWEMFYVYYSSSFAESSANIKTACLMWLTQIVNIS
jgi:hypothetical protein